MQLQSPTDHYRRQQAIAGTTAKRVQRLTAGLTDDFATSWAAIRDDVTTVIQQGRAAAVAEAITYTPAVLRETNQVAPPVGVIQPGAILRTAPDGRPLNSLLDRTPIEARQAVAAGATAARARDLAAGWLIATTLTVLADTGREAVSIDMAQRPAVTGYVRMLNPPSCARCVILAGKWYRWNQGFQRHPRCDCRHIPAAEAVAGDLTVDPYTYFDSLDAKAQERTFGLSNARAVREGADIFRVVNINQRGLGTARGARLYGTPTRMTPDDIFRVAGTRTNAIAMLEREGYITGSRNPTGNILGPREGFGALGRGGTRRTASDAVTTARTTGVRDPLNRYTMTEAERRLYDAHYRLQVARTGIYPRSVGQNAADSLIAPRPITPRELAGIEEAWRAQLRTLPVAPPSVRELARLLGAT